MQRHHRFLRSLGVPVLAASALAGLLLHGQALAQPDLGTVSYQNGMLLGRGYDSVSGLPRNDCVAHDPTASPPRAIRSVDYDLLEVSSTSDLLAATSVAAGVAVNAASFSASAEMSFASSSRINSFEASLLARVNVESTWQLARNPRLRPEFRTLAQTDPEAFRRRCGDRFVAGVLYGGSLAGLVRAATQSEDDHQRVAAAFRASYSSFSANGSFDRETASTLSSSRLEVEGFVRGGGPQPVPVAFDALRTRLQNFPEEVQGSGGAEISAMLLDYAVLVDMPVPGFTATVLDRMATLYWDLHGVRREIDYILANPTQFHMVPDAWRPHLTGLRGQAQQGMDTISRAAEACRARPEDCAMPRPLPEPSDLRGRYPLRYAGVCGREVIEARRLPTLELYPLGRHTRGDSEMDGNNPQITLRVRTLLEDAGRRLTAITNVTMAEGRRDWTTFTDERRSLLLDLRQAFPNCFVLSADVNPGTGQLTARGGNNNHSWTPYAGGTGLVASASCLSDTRGKETGRIGCRSIELRPLELRLRHEESRSADSDLRLSQVRQQQRHLVVARTLSLSLGNTDQRTINRLRTAAAATEGTQYLAAPLAGARVERLEPAQLRAAPRSMITPRAAQPLRLQAAPTN